MFQQHDFNTWVELENFARSLGNSDAKDSDQGYFSQLLFRGQGSYGWSLETTLERATSEVSDLLEYYRIISVAKTQIESFMPRSWPELEYESLAQQLSAYDFLRSNPLPHHDYLVYLRHHGFPSPLLDWSRSLYVAAFFAFQRPASERIAIFVYQEFAGAGKALFSNKPQIHTLGPHIRTHQRHFLQQAEYTSALTFTSNGWQFTDHMDVFLHGQENQDHLWKLTAPASEARAVMRQLEDYNINAFSLFQSEDALLTTLASRLVVNR